MLQWPYPCPHWLAVIILLAILLWVSWKRFDDEFKITIFGIIFCLLWYGVGIYELIASSDSFPWLGIGVLIVIPILAVIILAVLHALLYVKEEQDRKDLWERRIQK